MQLKNQPLNTNSNRRKILAGIGLLSLLPFFIRKRFLLPKPEEVIGCGGTNGAGTMKLLSQDGELVEVDISKITKMQQKVSDKEVLQWVKRK